MDTSVKKDSIKDYLHNLAESLPENANFEDVMYELYVKKKVDLGRKQLCGGNRLTLEEVKKRYNK